MHARTHATHPPWQRQAAWPGPPMPPGGPATARLALPWKTPPNREGPTLPRERGVAHRLGCPPLVVSPLVQKVLGGWESGGSVARSSQLLCHEAAVRQLSRLVTSPLVHGHAAAKPYLQRLGGREPQFQLVPRSVSSPCQPAHVASPLCWFGHSGAPPPPNLRVMAPRSGSSTADTTHSVTYSASARFCSDPGNLLCKRGPCVLRAWRSASWLDPEPVGHCLDQR